MIDVSLTQTVPPAVLWRWRKKQKAAFPSSWKIYMPWRKVIRSVRDQVDALAQGYTSRYQQSPSVGVGYIPSAIASPIQRIVAKVNLQENIPFRERADGIFRCGPQRIPGGNLHPQSQADDVCLRGLPGSHPAAMDRPKGIQRDLNQELYPTARRTAGREATVTAGEVPH